MRSIQRSFGSPRIYASSPICGLPRSRSRTRVHCGRCTVRLGEASDQHYQLIVLDVFSSDAIPIHLLTREVFRLYRSKLAEGGLLAFHLSNRYVDLDPVMGMQATPPTWPVGFSTT